MRRSSIHKLLACLLAALVYCADFLRITRRFFEKWLPPPVITTITAAIVLAAFIFTFVWIRRKDEVYHSSPALALCQAIIRYGVALDLILFGLQKFFGLQFSMPLALLDLPFSSFSGEDLTFAYFARSFGFVVVIGSLQVTGSVLLLFSRTKLIGIFILLPVVLNIVLLNIFYQMETGELVHASILLLALLYLLLQEYERLTAFFFRASNGIPAMHFRNAIVKNGLRYSAIFIPVLLVWNYDMPEKHPGIYGKYQVVQLLVNNQKMAAAVCADSVLTVVYFDQNADCVFEYNNQQKRLIGNYHLDERSNKLTVAWRYPAGMHDTLTATISGLSKDHRPGQQLTINGKMGNQSLKIALIKLK